jgi:hypothetical protein
LEAEIVIMVVRKGLTESRPAGAEDDREHQGKEGSRQREQHIQRAYIWQF